MMMHLAPFVDHMCPQTSAEDASGGGRGRSPTTSDDVCKTLFSPELHELYKVCIKDT